MIHLDRRIDGAIIWKWGLRVPTEYIKRETFDDKEIENVIQDIKSILLKTELDDENEDDTSRADAILELDNVYSWEVLQQAMFKILLDDNRSEDDYYQIAYYPSMIILRPDEVGLLSLLSPVIGLIFFYGSYKLWMLGASRYNGTGS